MSMTSIKQINGGKELQGDVHALLNIVGKDKEAFFNEILNWLLSEAPQDFNPEILKSSKLVKLVSSAVMVNNEEPEKPYLSFVEENNEPFTLKTNGKNWDGALEYSTDTENWSEWDGTEVSSSNDGKLYLRGTGNTVISQGLPFIFTDNKRIQCFGNIENLLDYQAVIVGNHPTMSQSCFDSLFCGSCLITAPELPSTDLASNCYSFMFYECTLLEKAPQLPAINLQDYCYAVMFQNCTALKEAPELPATEMHELCYGNMFADCTSLIKPPTQLPASALASNCYNSMFRNCTSLAGSIHCPASTASDPNRLDASTDNLPANTATVVYDL